MENILLEKLLSIEAKLSNSSFLAYNKENPPDLDIDTGAILRHSVLNADIHSSVLSVNRKIQNIFTLAIDLQKLANNFYNQREVQLENLAERLKNLDTKNTILRSITDGINIFNIILNDKKIIKPGGEYDITSSGVGFNPIEISKLNPLRVSITRDSNIMPGVPGSPELRSLKEALFNEDPNDMYTVHTVVEDKLKIIFDILMEDRDILNEITFSFIEKPSQKIYLKITNITEQLGVTDMPVITEEEVIFDKRVLSGTIRLEKPVYAKHLIIEIIGEYNPGTLKQLDMQELSFMKKKYSSRIIVDTINFPALTSKYLTVENINLENNKIKDLFSFKVTANGNVLSKFDQGLPAIGPLRDPYFNITGAIRNRNEIINFISEMKYKKSQRFLEDPTLKVIAILGTDKFVTITQEKSDSNSVFFDFPLPDYETKLIVSLNGYPCKRVKSESGLLLSEYYYYAEYTGTGYLLVFQNCQLGSLVKVSISSIKGAAENKKINFYDLGLGTELEIMYPKNLQYKRLPFTVPNSDIRKYNTYIPNLQQVSFISSGRGEPMDYIEVEKRNNLGAKEYFVDYENGIIYAGALIDNDIVIRYFENDSIKRKLETADLSVDIPSSLKTFEYQSGLAEIDFKDIYSYKKSLQDENPIELSKGIIQLPKDIILYKGSIRIYNTEKSKKEVDYIDGNSELYDQEKETIYYDYVRTDYYPDGYLGNPAALGKHIYTTPYPLAASNFINLKGFVFDNDFMINEIAPYTISTVAQNSLANGEYTLFTVSSSSSPFTLMNYSSLAVKNTGFPSVPALRIKCDIIKDNTDDLFSVDYKNNIIYTKDLSAFNGSISFSYTCINPKEFTLGKEVSVKSPLLPSEYYVYAYNREENEKLLPYYSPIIKSVDIGTVG